MQYNINTASGQANNLTLIGGNVTTGLYLTNDPVSALEAATKRYVDGKISTIPASSVVSGVMPIGRFPAYGGDIVSAAGSNVLTLKSSGVTTGTYPKVTVTNKGIVTQGMVLTSDDIPNLPWGKFSIDKPTTLFGFGVTDAVAKSGSTMTGFISVMNAPTQTLHAANKSYVDNFSIGGGSAAATGTIQRLPQTTAPTGYLRCNGALVSKTIYPALYAIIGDTYTPGPASSGVGLGKPWVYQYDINTTQSAALSNWVNAAGVAPLASYLHSVAVTKNRVYVMGGTTVSGTTYYTRTEVYTAPINPDGSLGTWTASTAMPGPKCAAEVVVLQNKLYCIGGYSDWLNSVVSNNTYVANINPDGTLGVWSTVPAPANPGGVALSYIRNGKLYCAGVVSGQFVLNSATINGDGSLGAWQVVSTPSGLGTMIVGCVIGDYVYSLNDYSSGGTYSNQVKRATINADGTLGAFTVVGSAFLSGYSGARLYITKNRIYAYGIHNFYDSFKESYSAPINADGSLGSWTAGGQQTKGIWGGTGFAVNNRLYLYAGWDIVTQASTDTIQYTSITGGVSDYSPYYDPGYQITDPNNFQLPDYSSLESSDFKYYIKY